LGTTDSFADCTTSEFGTEQTNLAWPAMFALKGEAEVSGGVRPSPVLTDAVEKGLEQRVEP
jgi:hypothetical protein